jgi:hypothetical protein
VQLQPYLLREQPQNFFQILRAAAALFNVRTATELFLNSESSCSLCYDENGCILIYVENSYTTASAILCAVVTLFIQKIVPTASAVQLQLDTVL